MGGSTLFNEASGSLSPEPVRTTTVTASLSIFPSRTSLNRRASGAADAGSANRPSLPASRICAERISMSVTALIAPPDSSRADVAPSHDAGLPTLIADATVFGSEEHTSELQSRGQLVSRLLLEKKIQTASSTSPTP